MSNLHSYCIIARVKIWTVCLNIHWKDWKYEIHFCNWTHNFQLCVLMIGPEVVIYARESPKMPSSIAWHLRRLVISWRMSPWKPFWKPELIRYRSRDWNDLIIKPHSMKACCIDINWTQITCVQFQKHNVKTTLFLS